MTPGTLPAELRAAAAVHGDRVAIVGGERRMTYAELDRAADGVAAGLHALGVRRGDRVAVMLPNGVEAAVAIYGALRAGAAFTPLNPTLKGERLARLLEHSGASAALDTPENVAELAGTPPRAEVVVDGDDLASIIYTSGSTGMPKGVAFLHRNMTFVAGAIVEYLGLRGDDRILCPLPLSHTYGLYHLIMAVRLGATLVLEQGMAFPGRVVEALERERITVLPGVPTTWQVLTSLDGLGERALPDLRVLTNAGAALSVTQIAQVRRTFPRARLFSMYGQTECKRVCYLPPEELDRRPGSVGIPIPGTQAWVARPDGSPAAPGEVGELMVRGDHVMQGYWHDPEATAAKLRPGGVLRTGDLFRADEDGYLYFVARTDDIIKTRGEKVAPKEVEEVLSGAPGVREAAVVGADDPMLGQAVVAHVSPASLDPRAVRRHCRQHLEDFKVPRTVVLHDALPKTHSGKVDLAALRMAA